MKVTQLRLASHAGWPPLAIERIGPELTVLTAPRGAGKSTACQLASHLIFGKIAPRAAGAAPPPEGALEVDGPQGAYRLRRHRDGTAQGRLSISSLAGAAVEGRTIRSLLAGISPPLLAKLYAVDFASTPQPSSLLEGEFAREFAQLANQAVAPGDRVAWCSEHAPAAVGAIDRRRVDELVACRDRVVQQIEQQMSGRRRESAAIEEELVALDAQIAERRTQDELLQSRLLKVEGRLAEIDAQLRFYSLKSSIRRGPTGEPQRQREALEETDGEIDRCRQMLAELQSREAGVRRELAEVHPDGRCDGAEKLVDQRATLRVLEQLMDDLDAEVAQLARAHEPGRCVGTESHGRITPVAHMMRQQLYALCGQVAEQQRAVRRVELAAESRQLSRAQSDLSERLEHLLGRRQSLVHELQAADRPAVVWPQAPAAGHCQCEGHDEFIRRNETPALANAEGARREDDLRRQRSDLAQQQHELRAAGDALAREIDGLQTRWDRLQHDRAQAAGRETLDELRAELARLEAQIEQTLAAPKPDPAHAAHRRPLWKASDVLAQLTDGQFTQIRLSRDGSTAIIDRAGNSHALSELSPAQQDQLYLSLTLALVSSFANRGVDLPLILDEPFLRQDAASAAAMAGVLYEFARQGRQVVLATGNSSALRQFETLGADTRQIDRLRAPAATLNAHAPSEPTPAPVVRLVRETVDEAAPQLRLARQWTHDDEDPEIYYLAAEAPLADFPVLGNDTAEAFAAIGMHAVADLLVADPDDVARRLKRPAVTADAVRLWQTHMSLMCYVPSLSLNDAQVLAACDVTTPEMLRTVDLPLLAESIARLLASPRGRRLASAAARLTRERLTHLQKLARNCHQRWQWDSAKYAASDVSAADDADAAPRREARRQPSVARQTPRAAKRTEPLRFRLERSAPASSAPSIGNVASQRLAKVGIRTVADLLNANPESVAEEIGEARVTAAVITRWQCEARLACRIPEMPDYGARLLAACGYTEPEQLDGASVDELFSRIAAVCREPVGRRALGKREAPSRQRVASWIRHAASMRPLEAA